MLLVPSQTWLKMEEITDFPREGRNSCDKEIAKEEQFFQGLLFAIEKGYTDLAKLLINEVGEIDCATPLFLALQHRQHRVFDMLDLPKNSSSGQKCSLNFQGGLFLVRYFLGN